MKKRTLIIWLIGVGLFIGVALLDRIALNPMSGISTSNEIFLLESILIFILIPGLGYLLSVGLTRKPTTGLLSAYILLLLVMVCLAIADVSANRVGWFVIVFLFSLLGLLVVLEKFIQNEKETSNHLWFRTSAYPLFDSLKDPCQYLLTLAGGKPGRWRLCFLKLWPDYVVIREKQKLPLSFRHKIFTFNLVNIRWLSSVQTFSDTESEVWFDLDVDGWWYTLRVRLKKSLVKQFVEQLKPGLSPALQTKDYRRYPNVRCGPVAASPVVAADGEWLLAGEPLQLYLTPLYLVVLNDTFVQQAISLNEIERLEVLTAANLSDQQIVRFGQGDKTLAFAVQDQDFVQVMKARF